MDGGIDVRVNGKRCTYYFKKSIKILMIIRCYAHWKSFRFFFFNFTNYKKVLTIRKNKKANTIKKFGTSGQYPSFKEIKKGFGFIYIQSPVIK